MRPLIAIDPGSFAVGVYAGPGTGAVLSTVDASLSASKQKATPRPERLAKLAEKLNDYLEGLRAKGPLPPFAAYEEQFVRGGGATKALFGAVGVIEAVLTMNNVGVIAIPQSTTRRWATEKMQFLKQRHGASVDPKLMNRFLAAQLDRSLPLSVSQDVADACVLYHFVQDQGEF